MVIAEQEIKFVYIYKSKRNGAFEISTQMLYEKPESMSGAEKESIICVYIFWFYCLMVLKVEWIRPLMCQAW